MKCVYCGRIIPPDDVYEVVDDSYICEDCSWILDEEDYDEDEL